MSFSPVEKGPVVRARHAYSHSASVGSLYRSDAVFDEDEATRVFSFVRNCWTSVNVTFSTGQRGPQEPNWLGDVPITVRHSCCVTSC